MVSSVTNPVNTSMKSPELNLGVVTPPAKHYKPVIYSDREASKQLKSITDDINSRQKHFSFAQTKQTPKLISLAAIIAALSSIGIFIISKGKKS